MNSLFEPRAFARTLRGAAATLILMGCAAAPLSAQQAAQQAGATDYPAKAVTLVVPWGAGGSGDITGRAFARFFEEHYKQPMVVENKPGANGIIGSQFVKKAAADGYTVMITSNMTHAANSTLFKSLPYDPQKDFVHAGLFGVFGLVALVPPSSPFKTIPDLVRYAKAHPDAVSIGYSNTSTQIAAELLKVRAAIPVKPVGYKAIANAFTDVLGGHTQMVFADYVAAATHVKAGTLVPIAVTATQRSPEWPDVPALTEFYPGYQVISSLGLAAPAGTPAPVVERLNRTVAQALADPQVKTQLEKLGYTLRPIDTAATRKFMLDESSRWADYIHQAKIEPQ